jgi:hypothetical protein
MHYEFPTILAARTLTTRSFEPHRGQMTSHERQNKETRTLPKTKARDAASDPPRQKIYRGLITPLCVAAFVAVL